MSSKPLRVNGYEIDRKWVKEIEMQIRLYPVRKARLEFLRAKYADRNPVDYHTYRSPAVDAMPGAPGHVGDPTGDRVVSMATSLADSQNMAYLEKWLAGMDMVLDERLDTVQRQIIEGYVMKPPQNRPTVTEVVTDCHASQTQCYYWRNAAFMEFAFLLLDEKHIRKIPEKNPKS